MIGIKIALLLNLAALSEIKPLDISAISPDGRIYISYIGHESCSLYVEGWEDDSILRDYTIIVGTEIINIRFSEDGKTAFLDTAENTTIPLDLSRYYPDQPPEIDLIELNLQYEAFLSSVALSPDGKAIAAAGGTLSQGLITIWDSQTGKEIKRLSGPLLPFMCLTYSPDGKYIASGGGDNRAILWDAKTGTTIRVFKGHIRPIYDIAFSPDGSLLITASDDEMIKIWDVDTQCRLVNAPVCMP